MLSLTDPLWKDLDTPYGPAEQVPHLLAQLQQRYDNDLKDELALGLLYHQDTLYSCTFAAVPYLVDIACVSGDPAILLDMFILCGIYEANNGNSPDALIPAEFNTSSVAPEQAQAIYRAYKKAIAAIAARQEACIAYVTDKQLEEEKRYLTIAAAAYAGLRSVAGMLLNFPDGEEYVFSCPVCEEDMYLWSERPDGLKEQTESKQGGEQAAGEKATGEEAYEGELRLYKEDPVFADTQRGASIEALPLHQANDVQLRQFIRIAQQTGDHALLAQLPYLASTIRCLHCQEPVEIFTALHRIY